MTGEELIDFIREHNLEDYEIIVNDNDGCEHGIYTSLEYDDNLKVLYLM